MAYEHEREEWRSAVRAATETELKAAQDSCRNALGIIGDILDDLGADSDDDGEDEQ